MNLVSEYHRADHFPTEEAAKLAWLAWQRENTDLDHDYTIPRYRQGYVVRIEDPDGRFLGLLADTDV